MGFINSNRGRAIAAAALVSSVLGGLSLASGGTTRRRPAVAEVPAERAERFNEIERLRRDPPLPVHEDTPLADGERLLAVGRLEAVTDGAAVLAVRLNDGTMIVRYALSAGGPDPDVLERHIGETIELELVRTQGGRALATFARWR